MKIKIIIRKLNYMGLGLVLTLLSMGHFLNAHLTAHEFELSQPLEQVEAMIAQRQAIKQKWQGLFRQNRIQRLP